MLLDSNIIIYAAQLENEFLREFIAENSPYVSALSYLEVLGYHRLNHQRYRKSERNRRIYPCHP
ncbi:hypothetical protein B5D77_23375 [Microcystis sp. MC19]|nr:hypothetical protein B5D77_23375 [Microcystis sp. MC19]